MDLSTVSFSNFKTSQVQELLRAFTGLSSSFDTVDGQLTPHVNRLDSAFIAEHFGCGQDKAAALLAELISGGYVDGVRLAPLTLGKALSIEKNLPRISRADADAIVKKLVAAAVAANARPGARVFVESLDVFGSYVSARPTLGDVDVRLVLWVDGEAQPENLYEMDEIDEMLDVSEYLSLTDQWDTVAAEAVSKRIYTRGR